MESEVYEENGHLIIEASGKLDTINAPALLNLVKAQLDNKPEAALLDLTKVSFLSSSGLQVLLTAAKIAKKEGFYFAVFGMQEMVKNVFTMSGFDRFIEDFASKKDALARAK